MRTKMALLDAAAKEKRRKAEASDRQQRRSMMEGIAFQMRESPNVESSSSPEASNNTQEEGTGVFNRRTKQYPLSTLNPEQVKERVSKFGHLKSISYVQDEEMNKLRCDNGGHRWHLWGVPDDIVCGSVKTGTLYTRPRRHARVCAIVGCARETRKMCVRCRVRLCKELIQGRNYNCYQLFHTPSFKGDIDERCCEK
ncbi:hypothetical protein SARC_08202 [Sphaeroforma arctica JP610]|uniref:Uncharacterized protein n=1 Tax=Sphaeroforma arctica JP610 TaxID=667725 RepID=A0A0L0FRE9_9EUKA|nr:hypothetical protein SARC_08202 [Sphaeroforma arctica JP610]KNC79402.1 hypothetical protein SARC_08202 [Sphaeroforma arctica JP610]|eukprot:XP_014153304.1 hypothetical protein SARC_08202 [Sphaeroforma arctica JP610]